MRQPCHKLGYIILLFMFRKKNTDIISHVLFKYICVWGHTRLKLKYLLKSMIWIFHLNICLWLWNVTLELVFFFLFCRLQYLECCQPSTSLSWKDFKWVFNYCHVQMWMTFSILMSPIQAKIPIPDNGDLKETLFPVQTSYKGHILLAKQSSL